MTSVASQRPRTRLAGLWSGGSAGRELAATLLLGALGAGLVFLATRPGWAQVRAVPPRPLPASIVTVTGAGLLPYAGALVLAGVATLAAILATRGVARRVAGVLLAAIGAALAAAAFTVSTAGAISAAETPSGPAATSAGSVLNGSNPAAPAVPAVAGATPHVTFTAAGWQALLVTGAVAMMIAGVLVIGRAGRLAVMSSRYDSPTGVGYPASRADGTREPPAGPGDSASMWEALSQGHDPTASTASRGIASRGDR